MKNILFIACIFVLTNVQNTVYAQTTTRLIGNPDNSHGYLVWATDTAIVKYHRYEIYKNPFSHDDTTTTIISRGEVWGKNYLLMPYEYFRPEAKDSAHYTFKLIGVDSNHDDVPEDNIRGPVGGVGHMMCWVECHSSDYAYRIAQFQVAGSGPNNIPNGYDFSYSLQMAYASEEEGNQVYHYRYFSEQEFSWYTGIGQAGAGTGQPNYHNMYHWGETHNSNAYPEDFIVTLENTGGSTFYDNTGAEIGGSTVKGIRKGFGPWYPSSPNVTNTLMNKCYGAGPEDNLNTWRLFINQNNPDLSPQLACAALLGGYTGDNPHHDDNNGEVGGNTPDNPCNVGFTYGPYMGGGGAGYTSFYGHYIECEDWQSDGHSGPNGDQGANIKFTDAITSCELYKVIRIDRDAPKVLISGGASSFVTEDGSPNIPAHNFEPGIHRLTVKQPGQRLKYVVFEVIAPFNFQLAHKDYFTGLIYPNPHQNQDYFIDIETSAKLKARYQVFDSNGNSFHDQQIDLPKDHSETHRISPGSSLPSGFLYHKFTFEDGSYSSYTTMN